MAASLMYSLVELTKKAKPLMLGASRCRSRGNRGTRAAGAETAALPVEQIPCGAAGSAQCGSALSPTEPRARVEHYVY